MNLPATLLVALLNTDGNKVISYPSTMHEQTTHLQIEKVQQMHQEVEQETTRTRTNSAPLISTTSSASSSAAHLHCFGHLQQSPQIASLLHLQHSHASWTGLVQFLLQTHFVVASFLAVTFFLHTAHRVASQHPHQQILVGGRACACTLAQQSSQPSIAQ